MKCCIKEAREEFRAELALFSYDGLIALAEDLERDEVVRGSWSGCLISYKAGSAGSSMGDRLGRVRNALTVCWDTGRLTTEEALQMVRKEIERRRAAIREPEIEVVGLGSEDWTTDEDREWQRYGTVLVRIDGIEYEVGASIGVPEYLIATATAAGGDTTRPSYLSAWYEDPNDWSSATRTDGGRRGIPAGLDQDVIGAIRSEVHRLWREHTDAASRGGERTGNGACSLA